MLFMRLVVFRLLVDVPVLTLHVRDGIMFTAWPPPDLPHNMLVTVEQRMRLEIAWGAFRVPRLALKLLGLVAVFPMMIVRRHVGSDSPGYLKVFVRS